MTATSSSLCIGWPADAGHPCPVYGAMHGCRHPDGHSGRHHVCECGAVCSAPPSRRLSAPCGTNAAYMRHLRRGDTPCQPCTDAHRVYNADRVLARKAARP